MTSQERIEWLEAELDAVSDGSVSPYTTALEIEAMIQDEIKDTRLTR